MKKYSKPTVEVVAFRADEQIANPGSGGRIKLKGNNGFGNGDQNAPGRSLPRNNAENGPRGNP